MVPIFACSLRPVIIGTSSRHRRDHAHQCTSVARPRSARPPTPCSAALPASSGRAFNPPAAGAPVTSIVGSLFADPPPGGQRILSPPRPSTAIGDPLSNRIIHDASHSHRVIIAAALRYPRAQAARWTFPPPNDHDARAPPRPERPDRSSSSTWPPAPSQVPRRSPPATARVIARIIDRKWQPSRVMDHLHLPPPEHGPRLTGSSLLRTPSGAKADQFRWGSPTSTSRPGADPRPLRPRRVVGQRSSSKNPALRPPSDIKAPRPAKKEQAGVKVSAEKDQDAAKARPRRPGKPSAIWQSPRSRGPAARRP